MVFNVPQKPYDLLGTGRRGGRGYGGGERGRLYTYRYTVTTRMIFALRWAAMRAILMFHICEGQIQKTVSADDNFWRERTAEADSNRGPSAYQPNALPLGQTGSLIVWTETELVLYPRWTRLMFTWEFDAMLLSQSCWYPNPLGGRWQCRWTDARR